MAAHYQAHTEFPTSGATCRFHQPKFKPTVLGAQGPWRTTHAVNPDQEGMSWTAQVEKLREHMPAHGSSRLGVRGMTAGDPKAT